MSWEDDIRRDGWNPDDDDGDQPEWLQPKERPPMWHNRGDDDRVLGDSGLSWRQSLMEELEETSPAEIIEMMVVDHIIDGIGLVEVEHLVKRGDDPRRWIDGAWRVFQQGHMSTGALAWLVDRIMFITGDGRVTGDEEVDRLNREMKAASVRTDYDPSDEARQTYYAAIELHARAEHRLNSARIREWGYDLLADHMDRGFDAWDKECCIGCDEWSWFTGWNNPERYMDSATLADPHVAIGIAVGIAKYRYYDSALEFLGKVMPRNAKDLVPWFAAANRAHAEGRVTRDMLHTVVARGLAGAGESLCAEDAELETLRSQLEEHSIRVALFGVAATSEGAKELVRMEELRSRYADGVRSAVLRFLRDSGNAAVADRIESDPDGWVTSVNHGEYEWRGDLED